MPMLSYQNPNTVFEADTLLEQLYQPYLKKYK